MDLVPLLVDAPPGALPSGEDSEEDSLIDP